MRRGEPTLNNEEYKAHLLKFYRTLVDFLAETYGQKCEVVLHDLSNIEASIIAIRNGHISGRKAKGPITDLVLKMVREFAGNEFLINYWGKTKDGKILKSSTLFIRDLEGKLFALLCLNFDVTNALAFRDSFSKMLEEFGLQNGRMENNVLGGGKDDIIETFSSTVDDLLLSLIDECLSKHPIPPERMSMEEKIELVGELDKKGAFLIKGSVAELARVLKISEPTVYRYYRMLNSKDNENKE